MHMGCRGPWLLCSHLQLSMRCLLASTLPKRRHGGTFKCLKHLLRNKLVHHYNSKCEQQLHLILPDSCGQPT